jgi:hypothetical protein
MNGWSSLPRQLRMLVSHNQCSGGFEEWRVGNPALRLVLRFTVWRGFHLLARDIAVASPTGAHEKPFRNIPDSGKM